ncbi:MAG: hypothetical protein ABJH82_14070 [Polaribacter sp.]|uniref:hypothetical protein n=1 Tax=Polaribacter sp. TaxID=1920175 RepID=UPI0032638957
MKKEIILLILGALTSIFLLKFDLQNGLEFLNIRIQHSLIDFARKSSSDKFLTTQIIGYLFFVIFILSIRKNFTDKKRIAIIVFIILLAIGIYNELFAIYENIIGKFEGRHCRVGIILTTLGTLFLISIKRLKKTL